jgi:hypothetical protein
MGVSEDVCNHLRSFLLYQAAIRNPQGFPAIRCDSYDDFLSSSVYRKCYPNDIVYMGVGINRKYINRIRFDSQKTNFNHFSAQLLANTTCKPMEIHTSFPEAKLVWRQHSLWFRNSSSVTKRRTSKSAAHENNKVFDLMKSSNKTRQQQISKSLSKSLHFCSDFSFESSSCFAEQRSIQQIHLRLEYSGIDILQWFPSILAGSRLIWIVHF